MKKFVFLGAIALSLLVGAPTTSAAPSKPNFTFKMGNYSVSESTSPANILITRSTGTGSASVHFRTASTGTATGGGGCGGTVDYVTTDTLVSFSAGQTQLPVSVPICPDTTYEGNETVVMQLYSPSGGYSLGPKSQVNLTIVDNDPLPTISIDNAHNTEGSPIGFTVSLSNPSAFPISVNYGAADNTAVSPSDYHLVPGTLNFAPLDTSKPISVSTSDDGKYSNPNETFFVTLSSPSGATIGTGTGTGTIDEASDPPYFTITDETGDYEGNTIHFTVEKHGLTESNAQVEFSIEDFLAASHPATGRPSCATPGSPATDYEVQGGTLVFAPGDTTMVIDVVTCADATPEWDETFRARLFNPQNATLDPIFYQGFGFIIDDDPFSLSLDSVTAGTDPGDSTTTAIVKNVSGGELPGVLVRFELYRNVPPNLLDNAIDVGGPGLAGYDYTGDGKDVFNHNVVETAGHATFAWNLGANPGENDAVVACVVSAQSATVAACGDATDPDGSDATAFLSGDNTDFLGPPNGTTDQAVLTWS